MEAVPLLFFLNSLFILRLHQLHVWFTLQFQVYVICLSDTHKLEVRKLQVSLRLNYILT